MTVVSSAKKMEGNAKRCFKLSEDTNWKEEGPLKGHQTDQVILWVIKASVHYLLGIILDSFNKLLSTDLGVTSLGLYMCKIQVGNH